MKPAKKDDFTTQALDWLPTATMSQALDFYEDFLHDPGCTDEVTAAIGRGDRFFLLTHLMHRVDAIHPWLYERCREVERDRDGFLDLWARDHYKLLAHDTPVTTPDGIRNHGDLQPGDYVFSPTGRPVKILNVTGTQYDPEMYRLTFTNGVRSHTQEIKAGGDHLWDVEFFDKRRISGTNKRVGWITDTLSTRELVDRTIQQKKTISPRWFKIRYTEPLHYPEKDLPIDPYTLGAWLGDGTSNSGAITNCQDELWGRIRAAYDVGHDVIPERDDTQTRTAYKLRTELRKLGLLSNKHIPKVYFTASLEQRTELLQGLMDTDGSVVAGKRLDYTTIKKSLADDVVRLLSTFGILAKANQYEFLHNGEPYIYYKIGFVAREDVEFFSLTYHKNRLGKSKALSCWYLIDIQRIPTEAGQCIQVEGGKYLAGEMNIPTHNSTWITFAGAVQEILNDPDITIGIFSHTRPIAKAFLSQIKQEFETNDTLKRLYSDTLWENHRQAPIWSLDSGIVVKRTTNPKESTVEAWGLVDSQPTSKHFGLLIFDDVVTLASVNTPDQIFKTTEAWEIAQNLGSSQNIRKWHIGTRYNFADTYGQLMERGALKARVYPATDDGSFDGKPVFLPEDVWETKKAESTDATIACQQLLNPLAGKEQEMDPEWLRTYEIRPRTLNVYIMGDYAGSRKSTGSSNTAIAAVGVDANLNKYLLDGVCHKMDLGERWIALRNMRRKWLKAPGIQVVKVGYERFGAQSDIQHFETMMKFEKEYFSIEEVNWPRDGDFPKDNRIRRLIPDFKNWRFFIPYDGEVTRDQQDQINIGNSFLLSKPIKRKNEENKVYDLVKWWIKNEYMFFPATTKKDFLDALSRIYDMDPLPPVIYGEKDVLPEPED